MRRIMGIVAFVCAFTVILATVATATDYTPAAYYYGYWANNEQYTGEINGTTVSGAVGNGGKNGTFTLPINQSTDFGFIYIGAKYNSVTYDVGAKYTFVITLTFGLSGNYDVAVAPALKSPNYKNTPGYGLQMEIIGASNVVAAGKGKVEHGTSNSITFTYTDIPYENVVGKDFYAIPLTRSKLTTGDENSIYIANTYFGLSSNYNEDNYKSQTIENMREINNNLTNINNNISDTNNKLDETNGKLDGIQNSIDNQLDDELNKVETGGNSNNAEAENSISTLPNFSESYSNILNNLTTPMYDESTRKTIPLPNGKVNVLGLNVDIWQGKSEVDLSTFLNNEKMQTVIVISKAFSILACMGISVKWAYKIKEAITSNDEVDIPVPFVDGK